MSFQTFKENRPAFIPHCSDDTRRLEPNGCRLHRLAALFLLFCVLVISAPITAYCDDYKPGIVGVPLSDKFVAGEIHLANADKEVVKFIAREGSVVVINGQDYHMAFSTRITPEGDVHLNYFNVRTVPGEEGGEVAQMFGCASAASGHFALPDTDDPDMIFEPTSMPFDVKVILVGDHEFVSPFFEQGQPIDPGLLLRTTADASCCARACDGTVFCGCAVQTGCSGCCSGDCCSVGNGKLQREGLTLALPNP